MSSSESPLTRVNKESIPWYTEEIGDQLIPETRQILETYSKIPSDQVEPHIRKVRQKLWDIRPYPCTGLFTFLVPWIKYHSKFNEIVHKIKARPDNKVLDVGCYIGHDLRALHWAGVPLASLYGLDVISFSELGWELFNDHDKFAIDDKLYIGDILDFSSDSAVAENIDGKMDVIWVSAVLHQFTLEKSMLAAQRLILYCRGAGSVIMGAQIGTQSSGGRAMSMKNISEQMADDEKPYQHDSSSLEKMWLEVGEEIGVDLKASVTWKPWEKFRTIDGRAKMFGADIGILEWTVNLL